MRSQDFGVMPDAISLVSQGDALEVFRLMCRIRLFEFNAAKALDAKFIRSPIYLSVGQESIAAALAVASGQSPFAAIFAQHRCHDTYLAYGGNPVELIDELLGRATGCANGMGGSASIQFHNDQTRMFGHDGHMGTQVPIGVHYSSALRKPTLIIMGDASAEEGFVIGGIGDAGTHQAPAFMVCVDNGLSILTEVAVRRSWTMAKQAESKGIIDTIECTDDPWTLMQIFNRYQQVYNSTKPFFLNVHTTRELWHAGTGKDYNPSLVAWNRFAIVWGQLIRLGLAADVGQSYHDEKSYIDSLWQKQCPEVFK